MLKLPIQLNEAAVAALKLRHLILQRSSTTHTWQSVKGARLDSALAGTAFGQGSVTPACVRLLLMRGSTETRLTLAFRFLHGSQATRVSLSRLGITTPAPRAARGVVGRSRIFAVSLSDEFGHPSGDADDEGGLMASVWREPSSWANETVRDCITEEG